MDKAIKIMDGIHWVGVNDRETDIFEALWPLPLGVAYNAYVIEGDKTVVIDTVKGPWFSDYLAKIKSVIGEKPVDYLVINHMEPDHSGAITSLRLAYPNMKLIGNPKTFPILERFYGEFSADGNVEFKDGESLDIGGHVLVFATVPMVHWPESMVTYDASTGILFSSDAFGGFGAHEGGLFDDQKCCMRWEDEMLRYFATIVGKYCSTTQAALKKLGGIELKMICPAHGTLFRKDVNKVVSLYDRWSKYENEPGAMVVYGSMYGNTKRMAEAVCRGLAECGFSNTLLYDVSRIDASYLLRDFWKMRGLIAVSCTYNGGLFPPMSEFFCKLANRKPKNHILGLAGNYSWSKGALDALRCFAKDLCWDRVEPEPEVFAAPTLSDLEACALLGKNMGERLRG